MLKEINSVIFTYDSLINDGLVDNSYVTYIILRFNSNLNEEHESISIDLQSFVTKADAIFHLCTILSENNKKLMQSEGSTNCRIHFANTDDESSVVESYFYLCLDDSELSRDFDKCIESTIESLDFSQYFLLGRFPTLQQFCAEAINSHIAKHVNPNALTTSTLPLIPMHLVKKHLPKYRDVFLPRPKEDFQEKYEPMEERTRNTLTRKLDDEEQVAKITRLQLAIKKSLTQESRHEMQ